MEKEFVDLVGLFVLFAGFVIGLGAVTVIDLHGFLGRKSPYWTEATIRTHKVTKPLIWIGMFLVIVGGAITYRGMPVEGIFLAQLISVPVMLLNGVFLSFVVSPFLLKQEREGKSQELLPASLQVKITLSFIVSFVSWWGNLIAVLWILVK